MTRFDDPVWWALIGGVFVVALIIRGAIALATRKKKPDDPI